MIEISDDTLRIDLGEDSYDITRGENLSERVVGNLDPKFRYAVITDSNVAPLYAENLVQAMEKAGLESHLITFPAGEENKTRATKEWIEDQMFECGLGRDTVVVGVGGGVTTDIAGYVAATFNRGVKHSFYSTTLLGQADAAMGGKTGVDTPYGKNLIGAFYQPILGVFMDVATFDTLPDIQLSYGLAETIKHGAIWDAEFFAFLEDNVDKVFARDRKVLLEIAKKNAWIKGSVVEQDVREGGIRSILNMGHTLAHGMEMESDYKLEHGAAVSLGLVREGMIAVRLDTGFTETDLGRLVDLLKKANLPIDFPDYLDPDKVQKATLYDKKARGKRPRYSLLQGIGKASKLDGNFTTDVSDEIVAEVMRTKL